MLAIIIAIEVLAIIANLALPMAQDVALTARASNIAHKMMQVREASLRVRAARSDWPPQPSPGVPPPVVTTELPPGLSLTHADYRLVWEHWSVVEPKQLGLGQDDPAGVTLIADDPRLAALVGREIPTGQTRFTVGNRTTLVIDAASTRR